MKNNLYLKGKGRGERQPSKSYLALGVIFSTLFLIFSLSLVSSLNVNIPVPINYSLIPTVNNSLFWQGHTGTDGSWLTGIIATETLWNANSSSVARTGNCPAGQVVMNTTNSGVECVAMSSGGGNPFDQSLNTTDAVSFLSVNGIDPSTWLTAVPDLFLISAISDPTDTYDFATFDGVTNFWWDLTNVGTINTIDPATWLTSETDPNAILIDQTTPQTFTDPYAVFTGTGLLSITSGTLGVDGNAYLTDISGFTTTDLAEGDNLYGNNLFAGCSLIGDPYTLDDVKTLLNCMASAGGGAT